MSYIYMNLKDALSALGSEVSKGGTFMVQESNTQKNKYHVYPAYSSSNMWGELLNKED